MLGSHPPPLSLGSQKLDVSHQHQSHSPSTPQPPPLHPAAFWHCRAHHRGDKDDEKTPGLCCLSGAFLLALVGSSTPVGTETPSRPH